MMTVRSIKQGGKSGYHGIWILSLRFRHFFIVLLVFLVVWACIVALSHLFLPSATISLPHGSFNAPLSPLAGQLSHPPPEVRLARTLPLAKPMNTNCGHHNCFDVYRCGHSWEKDGRARVPVYVYPLVRFVDEDGIPVAVGGGASPLSREYFRMLDAIQRSEYHTSDPSKACLFITSIDTLNQNHFRAREVSQALASLPFWNNGTNHIIFNMVPGSPPDYSSVVELDLGDAIVAGAGFSSWTYRPGYDVSLPVLSPLAENMKENPTSSRAWLLASAQINLHPEYDAELLHLAQRHPTRFLLLGLCADTPTNHSVRCRFGHAENTRYLYPQVLQSSTFCLVVRGARLGQPALVEATAAGCIPVVAADSYLMPFHDVIDWNRAALFVPESALSETVDRVSWVSEERAWELAAQVRWLHSQYMATAEAVALTTLDIITDRILPHLGRLYCHWNVAPTPVSPKSPLFLPVTAPREQGFTAVVLTYDRLESLFTLIQKLVKAPSLTKVLVIWNNQHKSPPHASLWPKVGKPLKVIRTRANLLSNRFYPYEEIETEAILTIDDDIVMLTADELEFGYEVWREFPDRIVGFPSRTHVWENVSHSWKYESEWTNHISMVLTGAAFHHKYWSYMYTTSMPGNIRDWVDDHMNCEDIAMNFLVANVTGKAPIKVTPRKKFKCPECTNTEMLSADLNHMLERSRCIDRFASLYGSMPLQSVEFRADPVLYRDNFPEKLKRFNDIGSL
ncbi:exostosin-2 [Hetaerina americana]|uniref:exostosin-2 n=1 Tax=Hetaerina americana TaxID=62018 RepID=UPI003A7F59BE